jgi:hypothetical protein
MDTVTHQHSITTPRTLEPAPDKARLGDPGWFWGRRKLLASAGVPMVVGWCLLHAAPKVHAENVSGLFQSTSFVVDWSLGPGALSLAFTTPSANLLANPQLPLNGEFEFQPNDVDPYQSCWILFNGNTPVEYGLVGFRGNALALDTDNNGIPNFLERSLPVTANGSVTVISFQTGIVSGGTVAFSRLAGRTKGTATTRLDNGRVFVGGWQLPLFDISGNYDLSQKTFQLRLTSDYLTSASVSGTFHRISDDVILFATQEFRLDSGQVLVASPITFQRFGQQYRAIVQFNDGVVVGNSFPDFRRWSLALTDSNDSDADGIPNFSDRTPRGEPPVILSEPTGVNRTAGQAVTFTVSAGGTGPFTYQWSLNGNPIPGATSASFTMASVRAGDAGSYTVRVTNAAGSVQSNAANLTVTQTVASRLELKRNTNGSVTLRWVGTGRLVYATRPDGTFTQVNGATNGHTIIPSSPVGFYRIVP